MSDDSDKIRAAVTDIMADDFEHTPIVGHVVVLCEIYTETGPYLFRLSSNDMPIWTEMGMLEDRLADLRHPGREREMGRFDD